ncbi:pupal cuticle protein Edg-84A-like [Teleopsis dalmanni]|uniref:pupal cuticle protein Edg-84A-like n=1 Tax=Teleopsis dalmanni TaxID=139649 RepID=UPI0018CDC7FA|nr:pupal cuticle protein Edg-84A-like [Teleopsis dalmanni]
MSWKIAALFICLVVVVTSQYHEEKYDDEKGPVHYEFSYSVKDPKTKDIKSQKESRKDDKVEGYYELLDSDGHQRIVHYKSDKKTGFEAIVERKPTNIKVPIPVIKYIDQHDDLDQKKYYYN